jgi:hypothetical protein
VVKCLRFGEHVWLNETYTEVRTGTSTSDLLLIETGLKEVDALQQLLCNLISEYDNMKDKKIQNKLQMDRTYQLLTYADDVKTLRENRNTIKKTMKPNCRLVWRLV